MATGVKIAAFGVMIRIFCQMFQVESTALRDTLWWLAVLTMTVGNVTALAQKSVKRMLAYSSISHAGYLLIGIVSLNGGVLGAGVLDFSQSTAATAILYYLIVYSVANLGAFAVLSMLEARQEGDLTFGDLAGLRSRYPLASLGLSIFMLSLAGIPGTGGFIGKFLVLGSAIDAADVLRDESLVLLAFLAVLNSLVSLYYYLRVPIQLYVRSLPEEEQGKIEPVAGRAFRPVLLLTIVGTLWLGFGPDVGFGVEAVLGCVRDALSSLK
jgi:NADH-quinone oxidoreductase subunit N